MCDLALTLAGLHQGEPIEVEIFDIRRESEDYDTHGEICYEIYLNDSDKELSDELQVLYSVQIHAAISDWLFAEDQANYAENLRDTQLEDQESDADYQARLIAEGALDHAAQLAEDEAERAQADINEEFDRLYREDAEQRTIQRWKRDDEPAIYLTEDDYPY